MIQVKKKNGSLRLCIDYSPSNKITIKDRYPIPRINEIIDTLSKAIFFTTLDATSRYYKIALNESDMKKKQHFLGKKGGGTINLLKCPLVFVTGLLPFKELWKKFLAKNKRSLYFLILTI